MSLKSSLLLVLLFVTSAAFAQTAANTTVDPDVDRPRETVLVGDKGARCRCDQ